LVFHQKIDNNGILCRYLREKPLAAGWMPRLPFRTALLAR
jgi:hypothetical protein